MGIFQPYSLHNHDNTGDTFYTRFFSKKGSNFGKLDLLEKEFLEDISLVITNLENIEGINSILDIINRPVRQAFC